MTQVKRLPAVWETRVQSLGWEDLLKKEMEAHSNIPAWRIPWTEEPGRLQSMGSQRVGHNWATSHSFPQKFSEKNVFYMCVQGRYSILQFSKLAHIYHFIRSWSWRERWSSKFIAPWCQGWGHPESEVTFQGSHVVVVPWTQEQDHLLSLMLWAGPPIPNIPSVSIMMVVIKSWPLPSHALHL